MRSTKKRRRRRLKRLLSVFGIVLLLGGLAHSAGVLHFYVTTGVPEANRVLLDLWIAEAHVLGGGLYLAASSRAGAGKSSPTLAVVGALTILGWTVPMLPVLFSRAPMVFRVPAVIYLVLSAVVLVHATRQRRREIGRSGV